MKKKTRVLTMAISVFAMIAMTVTMSGCAFKDKLKELNCKHDYGGIAVRVLEQPTCNEEGKGVWVCKHCGKEKRDKIAMLEHNYDLGKEIKAPTCSSEGEKLFTCQNEGCGKTKKAIIAKLAHERVDVEMVAPTCTETGTSAYAFCQECNALILPKQELSALGHSIKELPGYAATCTTEGRTPGKECAICGEVFQAQESIPAIGHTIVIVEGYAATCTSTGLTNGAKCITCGEFLIPQEIIPIYHVQDNNDVCTICGKQLEYWTPFY